MLLFFWIQRIWNVYERCFFTTRRGVLEKSFFNQFYWNKFWSMKFFLSFFGWEVWLWFCFSFGLFLAVVWKFLEIHMNFMLMRRFFLYFADFWAIFCNFWRLFFTASNVYWKDPYYLSNFLDNKWLRFLVMMHFLFRNMTKMTIFLNFFAVFRSFFCFQTSFLAYYDLTIVIWASILISYWLKGIFLWIYVLL